MTAADLAGALCGVLIVAFVVGCAILAAGRRPARADITVLLLVVAVVGAVVIAALGGWF